MKTLLTFGVLLLSVYLYGQSYGTTDNSANVTPKELTFEQYCIQEAASLMDISEEKRSSVLFAGEITIAPDPKDLNYRDLGIELKENETQYFLVTGSDKILAVKSLYILRLNYSKLK